MSEPAPKLTRLLLVDDDSVVAWTVGRLLLRAGFEVTTCSDGAEAVALLESTDFEVLVTDIQMPRLNGLALIEWVRQHRPDVPVVVMTAYGSPAVKQISLKKGAILYLEKPVDPELLVAVLKERSASVGAIVGNVTNIDLFDYIQLVTITRQRILVEVSSRSGARGMVFVDRGDVVHSVCDVQEGEEAFFKCMTFQDGTFATLPWREPVRRTITRSGEFLLMEAARRRDEENWQMDPSRPDNENDLSIAFPDDPAFDGTSNNEG